jgi:lipopolysaccharide heptosyltransferase II
MSDSTDFEQAENILCVRLDTIGDVLMTTPAIKALKESKAGRRITLLTSRFGATVAKLVAEIDEIIVYDAPWMKATARRENSRPEYEMIERLRQGKFDAAVIFTVYSQNPMPAAFLCYMADIPLRLAHCHEQVYQMLTHSVQDHEPHQGIRHEVRRHLDLVASVGCRPNDERMSLKAPDGAVEQVEAILEEVGIEQTRPWIVVHPGATAASRRYPPEGFAEAGRLLVEEMGLQLVFTGSGDEAELVSRIQNLMGVPSYSLVDRLDLGEMTALLSLAPLLLANNTGPVHMAAALGTPVVDLYALTNPQHTPWAVPNRVLFHDVPCKYCYKSVCPEGHHNCLRLVTPAQIVRAVRELLEIEPTNETQVITEVIV